jgi:hypothetical protein
MRVRPDAIKVTTSKFKFTQDKMALRHKILNERLIPLRRYALVVTIEDSCIIYQVHINLKEGAWVPQPIRHSDLSPEFLAIVKQTRAYTPIVIKIVS